MSNPPDEHMQGEESQSDQMNDAFRILLAAFKRFPLARTGFDSDSLHDQREAMELARTQSDRFFKAARAENPEGTNDMTALPPVSLHKIKDIRQKIQDRFPDTKSELRCGPDPMTEKPTYFLWVHGLTDVDEFHEAEAIAQGVLSEEERIHFLLMPGAKQTAPERAEMAAPKANRLDERWELKKSEIVIAGTDEVVAGIADSDGVVWFGCDLDGARPIERARLMVAAPDLLAALELMLISTDYIKERYGVYAIDPKLDAQARAAIAKAKGIQ